MLHMFHTYVACVLSGCCVGLQWFSIVFRYFFSNVSEAYFKCFIYLETYVATVVFGCFKNRSGVAFLLLPPSVASSLPEAAEHPYERGMGAMGAGRGSYMRRAQVRGLGTNGRCFRSGMGAGRSVLRTSWFESKGTGSW